MPEWVRNLKYEGEGEKSVSTILFKNANIFDGKDSIAANSVLVEGNHITKVGTDLELPTLEGADDKRVAVVDCQGKTLMPGLIDMHSHLVRYFVHMM